MALLDGFFDSFYDPDTDSYDREYGSDAFTEYFEQTIGSGVCVHKNPDSFLVRLEDGKAVVSPGYLFLQGYWLRNDEDYALELPSGWPLAVTAYLNLGKRMIELLVVPAASSYPDSLVLAVIDSGAAEDTRCNTDLCGVIDAPGALTEKIEYALHYIDSEAEKRLSQIEKDLAAQEKRLDSKISEVEGEAGKMQPSPIGTVRFSAAPAPDGWLLCDGSFLPEALYPELVSVLRRVNPGVVDFQEISGGRIPAAVSNGVLYSGYFWLFSSETSKLYGLSTSGGGVKEISVTGFTPWDTARTLVYLSIFDSKLFLAQTYAGAVGNDLYVYVSFGFDVSADSVPVKEKFCGQSVEYTGVPAALYVSRTADATYRLATSLNSSIFCVIELLIGGTSGDSLSITVKSIAPSYFDVYQTSMSGGIPLMGYSRKNRGAMVYAYFHSAGQGGTVDITSITARPYGIVQDTTCVYTYQIPHDETFQTMSVTDFSKYVLLKYKAEKGKFYVTYVPFAKSIVQRITVESVSLPSAARVFADAAAYLERHELWVFFVGTGLVFSPDLTDPNAYGYFDTSGVLGTIFKSGYVEFDAAQDMLYISGQDNSGAVKVARMKIASLYDYEEDGVWLPKLSMSSVPGYIKAKEIET